MPQKVAVLVGSLRKDSLNKKAAHALAALAPELSFDFVEIGDLALYNQDLDPDQVPASWQRVRKQVKAADAVLFVTPEYNRSVPGVLKNAIDVISRPYGANNFDGKPGAVMTVSPGNIGGFGANHHLRQSLVFLNVLVLQQPEAYISGASKLFGEDGNLTNPDTEKFFKGFIGAFEAWIRKSK